MDEQANWKEGTSELPGCGLCISLGKYEASNLFPKVVKEKD